MPSFDTPVLNSFKKKRAIFSTENLSTPLRKTSIYSIVREQRVRGEWRVECKAGWDKQVCTIGCGESVC